MAGSVEIVEWTMPKRYVYVEEIGPYFQVGSGINRLFSISGIYDMIIQPPQLLAIWLDDPEIVPHDKLRSQVGAFIDPLARIPDEVQTGFLATGRYARLSHIGSYSDLPEVWRFLYTVWLPHSGERARPHTPGFELYCNSPLEVPRNELVTELHIPLQNAKMWNTKS